MYTLVCDIFFRKYGTAVLLLKTNRLDTSYYNIIKALPKYRLHYNGSNINGRQNVQCFYKYIYDKREV